jgi:ABC-type nitrate/sulfonate/bicarbonate transport system substrate-binding protein
MPASSIQYFYLTVAQEQGFYREQGLDAELHLAAANAILAALTAGELDYTAGIPGGIRRSCAASRSPSRRPARSASRRYAARSPTSASIP